MSHTPSPWTVEQFSMVVSHERRQRIADVGGNDAQERADNARLIAAAPDLLEALKGAIAESGCDGDLCMYQWHETARTAIAKAEGQS